MADAHLEASLGGVDGGHTGAEVGAMGLLDTHHPIHPGVDHFVAEGAEGGFLRQGIKQGPRQHDFAQGAAIGMASAPVEPGGAAHAAVAPAQIH